eukprot:8335978-Lingulodinium_polyedra.AAC.1
MGCVPSEWFKSPQTTSTSHIAAASSTTRPTAAGHAQRFLAFSWFKRNNRMPSRARPALGGSK